MKIKPLIKIIFIAIPLCATAVIFGLLRINEQSVCETNEILACCSLYEAEDCYISSDRSCLTEYNIKCVPRHNNYPVFKPKP